MSVSPSDQPSPTTAARFRERLVPGPAAWCGALGLGVIVGVTLWPLSHVAGIVSAVLAAASTLGALIATAPVIEVADGELRAGRAHVALSLLGDVTPMLDAEAMRTALGPALDARAYVCLRAWARTGVQVQLADPMDPTPYWLVSTRRPAELAAALRA
ncbi:DUF3093 domain-containing protein [Isoptericola sp. NEAU-Y5]|uniref:DUF3093 domain-containing protein n=1 Tax=Isoptericola luteus TaxID=2879484 RepID=A0ABS7ZFW1_9MICO|nr:DUF3093 domain-containing protein [Isoptericola sp. NEAU-Y5]MCA5893912.1 DUF3093 domain-containing protein [Isoptericola sp. NEAU-Y5]